MVQTSTRRVPPRVRARMRAKMTAVLENPVEKLRAKNPDKDYRFVRVPVEGEDFGAMDMRSMMGYKPVSREESEVDGHSSTGDFIRVGDVILMEIDKEERQEILADLTEEALAEASRPEETYKASVRAHRVRGQGAEPVGEIEYHETEHEYVEPEKREEG